MVAGIGPMGTGMEEVYQVTSALKHLPALRGTPLLTDARFSGVSTGPCVGHIGPEALAGGPLGRLRDGDLVRVEIDTRALAGRVDLVREDPATGELVPDPETLASADAASRAGAAPEAAGRDAPVGGAAGREWRHVGRLRLRCGRDHGKVEVGPVLARRSGRRRVRRA